MRLMKSIHSFTNRKEGRTLVDKSENISARCQVHLGMLAKANKFSRAFTLQNSNGDGMSTMRRENSRHFSTKRRTNNEQNPCFVFRLFRGRLLALLNWIKESLSTETCATCQSQSILEKNVLKQTRVRLSLLRGTMERSAEVAQVRLVPNHFAGQGSTCARK